MTIGSTSSDSIQTLVGEQLSAVSFVMDYVELHFDGAIVRALNNPRVEIGDTLVKFPEIGSRDALCQAIGLEVEEIRYIENVVLRVAFGKSLVISIPLDAESFIGPEALHWCPRNGPMEIWQ